MAAQSGERAGGGERVHVVRVEVGAARQIVDVGEGALCARGDQTFRGRLRTGL